jgi:hypothetical protein
MNNFFKLEKDSKEHNYCMYKCNYIIENKDKFIEDANLAYKRFVFNYPKESSTWFYRYYNVTSLLFGSIYYYNFFINFKKLIRRYSNTNKPLWYQSWLNFDDKNKLLDWHEHKECTFHGYVSIDPKETITEFKQYKIKNKIGNVYIGEANKLHKVSLLKQFEGKRITLGFDIIDDKHVKLLYNKVGNIDVNLSFLPIE